MSVSNLLFPKRVTFITIIRNLCSERGPLYVKRKRICLYETLQLNKDCSSAEIRNAYLRLSKEYHPDINKDKRSHQKFLEISEAYNVLSKPLSKRDYDAGLTHHFYEDIRPRPRSTSYYTDAAQTQGAWSDDTFWEFRNRSNAHHFRSQPYYGIKGIKKISNFWIALLCLGFASFGVVLQFLAIRKSFTLKRSDMDQRSAQLEMLHAEIRQRALRNGDEKQLELMIQNLTKNKKD